MIKRKNKIHNIKYLILTIVEIMLLLSLYFVRHFTKKKMGMARYVSYLNYSWEEKYPTKLLIVGSAITLIILTTIVISAFLLKRKTMGSLDHIESTFMLFLTIAYVWFTMTVSRELDRSYYTTSILLGIVALLQIGKCIVGMKRWKHEA